MFEFYTIISQYLKYLITNVLPYFSHAQQIQIIFQLEILLQNEREKLASMMKGFGGGGDNLTANHENGKNQVTIDLQKQLLLIQAIIYSITIKDTLINVYIRILF